MTINTSFHQLARTRLVNQLRVLYLVVSEIMSVCLQLLKIVRVFVTTVGPYLSIIDEWLTNGNHSDPHSEFVIKKFVLLSICTQPCIYWLLLVFICWIDRSDRDFGWPCYLYIKYFKLKFLYVYLYIVLVYMYILA